MLEIYLLHMKTKVKTEVLNEYKGNSAEDALLVTHCVCTTKWPNLISCLPHLIFRLSVRESSFVQETGLANTKPTYTKHYLCNLWNAKQKYSQTEKDQEH